MKYKIDACDEEKIKGYTWRVSSGYMRASTGEYMHHVVMGKPKNGMVVDHINKDKLDNRRCNLRIVNQSLNAFNQSLGKNNTSGVTGVSWDKKNKKWEVNIMVRRKNKKIGRFKDLSDAIAARVAAEIKYFGEPANKEVSYG